MSEEILKLEKRKLIGKQVKRVRLDGKIPSVVYGRSVKEPILTESPYNETEKTLNKVGYHSTISLDIDDKKQLAMVKAVSIEPVKRKILNIEFQAVSANRPVEAITPIVIVGFEESAAAKMNLAISQVLEDVAIKAKPANLVKGLEINASKLAKLEEKLTIADLELPRGVEFADPEIDLESAIAIMYDPVAEAAAREAEETKAEKSAEETKTTEDEELEVDGEENKMAE